MQNSTLKHPENAQKRSFISSANHARCKFIPPQRMRASPTRHSHWHSLYLHKPFQITRVKNRSWVEPCWSSGARITTDSHEDFMEKLYCRLDWRGNREGEIVRGIGLSLLVPSLAYALPFSLQLSLTMRRGDICILRIPNMFLMRSHYKVKLLPYMI